MSDPAQLTDAAPSPPSSGERALAALYVPVALAMLLLLPGGHPFLILPAAAAVTAYLLQRVIRLPLADGYVSVVQPAFVVLMFAVPLNLVAVLVPLGLFASTIVGDHAFSARRLALALADAWYCIPPVLIVALLAPGRFAWHHWPVYLAALLAELAVSFLGEILRLAIDREIRGLEPAVWFLPAAIDLLLTPFGAAAAHAGTHAAEETLLVLAAVLTLVALLGRERTARIGYEHRALRDGLTGLANRALFDEMLDAATRRLVRSGESGALLFIDVDNFKQVNDVHGHLAGDEVLKATAARVQSVVRGADTVARFGGDEFAVLLAEPIGREAVERLAGAIRHAVSAPINLGTTTVSVTASIGLASLGSQTESADAVALADEAMYEAKHVSHEAFAYRS